jgi:uncharacterized membrane protein
MSPATHRKTFMSDFRRFFGRGLAVLLPSILTLWLLWTAFVFLFNNVALPINRGLRGLVVEIAPLVVSADPQRQPAWYRVSDVERSAFLATREGQLFRDLPPRRVETEVRYLKFRELWRANWYLEAAGLLVAIILVYLAGLLLGGYFGRRLYSRLEGYIARIPGFKQVYPHVKQLVELIIGEKPMAFKRVVFVEYPRKGIWTLGLVTSNSMKSAMESAGSGCLAIFIPSTPTPFTGFTISVPEVDVIDVPISIDEALRFVLTGGVLVPERQMVGIPDAATAELRAKIEGRALETGRGGAPGTGEGQPA